MAMCTYFYFICELVFSNSNLSRSELYTNDPYLIRTMAYKTLLANIFRYELCFFLPTFARLSSSQSLPAPGRQPLTVRIVSPRRLSSLKEPLPLSPSLSYVSSLQWSELAGRALCQQKQKDKPSHHRPTPGWAVNIERRWSWEFGSILIPLPKPETRGRATIRYGLISLRTFRI